MMRLSKQAGTLKADHPGTWKLGEELAAEALATRSPDLIRMIHERGDEGSTSTFAKYPNKSGKAQDAVRLSYLSP